MDPRDVFVPGRGGLGGKANLGKGVQQWLQALPGTVYITDARWWLGELHFLSESVSALGQRAAADYRSRPELWLTQIAESECHRLLEQVQQALASSESSLRFSYVISRPDKTSCVIEDDINILRDDEGEVVALVGTLRPGPAEPVTEGRPLDSAQALGALSERAVLSHSEDLIMALDEDLDCRDVAGNTRDALGVAEESLLGASLFGLMAPGDGSRIRRLLAEGAAESASRTAELRLRHRDGEYRWFEIQFSPCSRLGNPEADSRSMPVTGVITGAVTGAMTEAATGASTGWLAVARNVTLRRQQSLQWDAFVATDELTSALKREPFMGLLGQAFASGEAGMRFTLIVFSVDHFSDINHAWGREGGDLVLSCVGEMCRAILRERFSFGRLGGDTFALLLSDKSLQETAAIAERLRGRLAATRVEFHGHWLAFSVSLGVAERHTGESAEAVLMRAEAGMIAAREHGRDRVQQAP